MTWNVPPPPSILLWATIIGVGFRFVGFLWSLYQRRLDRERSIVDEFWYRTIILPICLKPLVDLISEYIDRLHKIDGSTLLPMIMPTLRDLALEFGVDKNRVLGRFLLLSAFEEEIYRKIGETLDALEDDITEYCSSINKESHPCGREIAFIEQLFWSKLADICKEMIKLHPHGRLPA